MKRSGLSFIGGMFSGNAEANKGNPRMVFDWDKCARIIKKKLKLYPDLEAEAGLQGDWAYTGDCIFENGKIVKDPYTYLSRVEFFLF